MADKCSYCKDDRESLKNQIERLKERLGHSQLQIRLLEAENERLHQELREAKWNGMSASARSYTQPGLLPTELMRAIFKFATSSDGLGFPHGLNPGRTASRSQSAVTRRTIPLVCRRWYHIGIEFLYERIPLFHPSQAQALQQSLESNQRDCINFIRGFELLPVVYTEERAELFASAVRDVLALLPRHKLEFFAFQLSDVHAKHSYKFLEMMGSLAANMIQQHHESLQILSLPFTSVDDEIGRFRAWRIPLSTLLDRIETDGISLSKLHTFSQLDSSWLTQWRSLGISYVSRLHCPSLKTLYLDLHGQEWKFYDNLQGLTCLYLNCDYRAFTEHMVTVITSSPALRQLSIYIRGGSRYSPPPPDLPVPELPGFVHRSLTEIKIWVEETARRDAMKNSIRILFDMLENGMMACLHTIVLCGFSYRGCLDGDANISEHTESWWRDKIEFCARYNISLTDPSGYPIHLWDMVYGIQTYEQEKLLAQTPLRHFLWGERFLGSWVGAVRKSSSSGESDSVSDGDSYGFEGSSTESDGAISNDFQDMLY